MAQKVIPRHIELHHPNTRLFLNSQGNPLTKIVCKHFKDYIGLPITAYDFRRSLSTFCLDSKDESIKKAESSVLRHREETGYAYYYQKQGETVEYVSIQYAVKHGLVKANEQTVDKYCLKLRNNARNAEWEISQKRVDKALEYEQNILQKRKEGLSDARKKGGRNWILPKEYDDFMCGIEEAISLEEKKKKAGDTPGPFSNLLNYKPGAEGAGIFPPLSIWQKDMYRVLYGLHGEKGDAMRRAELSVYDGVPFAEGFTGRKKIEQKKIEGKCDSDEAIIVAGYWYDKIRAKSRQIFQGKWLQMPFIFSEKELEYNNNFVSKKIKYENI